MNENTQDSISTLSLDFSRNTLSALLYKRSKKNREIKGERVER
jgi:hypothetical protein